MYIWFLMYFGCQKKLLRILLEQMIFLVAAQQNQAQFQSHCWFLQWKRILIVSWICHFQNIFSIFFLPIVRKFSFVSKLKQKKYLYVPKKRPVKKYFAIYIKTHRFYGSHNFFCKYFPSYLVLPSFDTLFVVLWLIQTN